MLALGQNNIYDFRLQTLTQVQQMLMQLLQVKEQMLQHNVPVIEKMYHSLEALNATLLQPTMNKPIQAFHESALTFLDKDLMEIFYNDPLDQEMRDALSVELVLVSAATGNIPSLNVYTDEEMLEILKGNTELAYYDDSIFVYTLRKSFESNTSNTLFSSLTRTLPNVTKDPDNMKMYYWDDAFIMSMILHSIWKHFLFLPPNDQLFLLQNYYYQSIIIGVPVRFALQEAVKLGVSRREGEKVIRFLVESLLQGKETIPYNTFAREGKLTGDVIKEFFNKSTTEQINTLVQEKFVSDIYRGQEDNEFFAAWLREALSLAWSIRSNDILKVNYAR